MNKKAKKIGLFAMAVVALLMVASAQGMSNTKTSAVRATVVIQFGNGEVMHTTVYLSTNNTTAFHATDIACAQLGLKFVYSWSAYGGFVKEIGWEKNSYPGPWWHFMIFKNNTSEWTLSSKGASSVNLSNGDVIGWMYTEDNSSYSPIGHLSAMPGQYDAWVSYRGSSNNTGVVYSNFTGTEILWKFKGIYEWGFSTTPAVYHGTIYIADDKAIYALSPAGTELWNNSLGATFTSSPTVYNDVVIVGTANGHIRAFYRTNGTVKWDINAHGYISSSPVVDIFNSKPIVLLGTDNSTNSTLYAIDAQSGNIIWKDNVSGAIHFAPVAVSEGKVVVVTSGAYNSSTYSYMGPYSALCLNESNGEILWNATLASQPKYAPAIYKNTVFIPYGNKIGAFEMNGSYLGSIELNGTVSSPAVKHGSVYVGTGNGNLYSLSYNISKNSVNWSIEWNATVGAPINGIIAAENGLVFTTNNASGSVYFYSYTGHKINSFTPTPSNYMLSLPVVLNSMVLVASNDGYLFALGNNSARPKISSINILNNFANVPIEIVAQTNSHIYQAYLYYRTSHNTDFNVVTMKNANGVFVGYIPPQKMGTIIEYYITFVSDDGQSNSTAVHTDNVNSTVPELSYFVTGILTLLVLAVWRKL